MSGTDLAPGLPLVLASASPRRRALLERARVCFEIVPADVPEVPRPRETARDCARRLARDKALAVARRLGSAPPRLVLGADTVVVLDGEILGKPADAAAARATLARLAGRRHRVITAVALVRSASLEAELLDVASDVTLRPASADEIAAYVASGEPLDKAGAYAAQGEGRRFIRDIEGSETNVIGLPLEETLALLRAAGAAVGAAVGTG